MLAATIKVSNINYEDTYKHIFPAIQKKIMAHNSQNMLLRLFQKLDEAALPVLMDLMYRVPEDTKDELLIRCLNAYALELTNALNEALLRDELGQYITIRSISLIRQDDGITLQLNPIQVKYRELLASEKVNDVIDSKLGKLASLAKHSARFVTAVAPDATERQALSILWRDRNKARLMGVLETQLIKYGVVMNLEDLQLTHVDRTGESAIEVNQPLELSEAMEEDILAALAGYLRSTVHSGDSLTD